MRFVLMPKHAMQNFQEQSMVKLSLDDGLTPLAERLGVTLYTKAEIQNLRVDDSEWAKTITSFSLHSNEVVAVAPNPGSAILLMVRNTFKSPMMVALYTIFVLAAAFHAFNGFWTFLIAWGVLLSYRSQKAMIPVCFIAAVGLALLGLAAIWGSYLL
jgi:succinate dehydrogenase / fumarate reductase cytochrome b subunit